MPSPDQGRVQVLDTAVTRKPLPIVTGEGSAYAVLGPENGATYRTVNILELGSGARTVDLRHRYECVYYIAAGAGLIRDLADGAATDLAEGSMIHIGAEDAYRLEAGQAGMTAIGGTVPADPALYEISATEAAE
ncbi:MAG: hypothetical protein DI556_15410 [Rhodovulum sulfidophilum]|uniref:N-acetyldiaminobutyrate dehydratase n=1 Tax=Rhodovulum sulfidophilum TaxID=35806 RepID=A0A2W5N467_RHOSU|nr:MAG: hypothetical protein DI556_15410 [Rhodovulum sulfidophilum]